MVEEICAKTSTANVVGLTPVASMARARFFLEPKIIVSLSLSPTLLLLHKQQIQPPPFPFHLLLYYIRQTRPHFDQDRVLNIISHRVVTFSFVTSLAYLLQDLPAT